jgi:hypothetical protein
MSNRFYFKNFEPDFQTQIQANLIMTRTLEAAPYGAVAIGLIEKQGQDDYCCALDINSKAGPFVATAIGPTPEKALEYLEGKIQRQIAWWKTNRGRREAFAPN